jgi:hypothetical protein
MAVSALVGSIVGLTVAAVAVLICELVARYRLTAHIIPGVRVVTLAAIYVFLFRPAFPNEVQRLAAFIGVFGFFYGALFLLAMWLRRGHNQRRSHPDRRRSP